MAEHKIFNQCIQIIKGTLKTKDPKTLHSNNLLFQSDTYNAKTWSAQKEKNTKY
jgi:hypothetical protein